MQLERSLGIEKTRRLEHEQEIVALKRSLKQAHELNMEVGTLSRKIEKMAGDIKDQYLPQT